MSGTQKITPMLWFDDNAEEAVNLIVSIFKNSRIVNMLRYGDAVPRPKGGRTTGGLPSWYRPDTVKRLRYLRCDQKLLSNRPNLKEERP
jgi:3-demethylubiquinone-9 3-methyltransferase